MKLKYAVYIFIAFFLTAALTLGTTVFFMERAGRLSERTASIALPNEGGYVEAWTPYLSQIARTVGVPELNIKTYTTYTELELIIREADKLNLLWAEVPLSAQFPVNRLYEEELLCGILLEDVISQYYPQSIVNVINKTVTGDPKNTTTIPISYNPWIRLYKTSTENMEFVFDTAAPGSTETLLLASFTYFRSILSTDNNILSIEDTLNKINEMSNDATIQKNVYSYTIKDAQTLFVDNKVSKLVLSIADLPKLPNEELMRSSVHSMGKVLSTDITYAVFPNRASEKAQTAIKLAQGYLLIPEIVFTTANSRNWLPAYIGTVAKNVYTDFTRKQARQTKVCLVPDLQYANDEEYKKLLSSIKEAFSSKYILEKTE